MTSEPNPRGKLNKPGDLRLTPVSHISPNSVTIRKAIGDDGLFWWFCIVFVPVLGGLYWWTFLLSGAHGEAEHHGRVCMVDQRCLPQG